MDKNQIAAAGDLPFEVVPVPEWGGSISIRTMSARERWQFRVWLDSQRKSGTATLENYHAGVIAFAGGDETGKRLFDLADVEMLAGKSGLVLERLYEIANRLNRLTSDQADDAEKKLLAQPERLFLFDLAERLHKTVRQLENELGSDELVEWIAREKIAGSGQRWRDSLHTGQIIAAIYNAGLKPDQAFAPRDFMTEFYTPDDSGNAQAEAPPAEVAGKVLGIFRGIAAQQNKQGGS